MQVTSKRLPKTQAELTIELSPEEVQPYVETAAKRISQEVEIKGFRKGKAPYDLLKQHVGEATIYEEAFNDIVQATYPKAVDQEKLQVVGRANIQVEKIAPGNPVVYKATVPLMPKVTLGDYQKLKTKKETTKLDEEKYNRTLEDLRRMRAKEVLVNREARKGDKTVFDFVVKVDGVAIEGGTAQQQSLVLGEAKFIPGFEDNLIGTKKGDEKDFTLEFPKDYFKKDLAGKPASFHVKVHDVYEIQLPELNDAFATEMNFKTLTELQEEIKKNILRELEQETQEKFELAVIEEIMSKSTFEEVPEQLLDEETDKMVWEIEQDVLQRGLKFEDYLQHMKKTREEMKKEFSQPAEKRIKAALVMREVAVAEKIVVDPADVQKEIDDMKKVYEQVPGAVEKIDSKDNRSRLENVLFHKKTFAKLEEYTK